MATFTTTRHLLRVSDLSPDELTHLLDLAARMKAHPYDWVDELRGHTIVSLFDKPSTRTRVSFAAAAQRLGMLDQVLRPDELQLGRGETVADTARARSPPTPTRSRSGRSRTPRSRSSPPPRASR